MANFLRFGRRGQDPITATCVIASPSSTPTQRSFRKDKPYGTELTTSPGPTTYGNDATLVFGKVNNGGSPSVNYMKRTRIGLYFPIPAGTLDPTTLQLDIDIRNFSSTLETCVAEIWASSTDDSAWTPGWENNLNVLCASTTTSGFQTLTFANSNIIAAAAGGNLSLIIGQQQELAGTGTGISGSLVSQANTPGQTVTLRMIY